MRDYIHVVDLADGHTKAIDYINEFQSNKEPLIVNLGTGKGYSVLEMVKAFESTSKKSVLYKIVERRAGDIAKCYADPTRAHQLLK